MRIIPRKNQVIGITGSICTGKSFALKYLAKLGFRTVSMDALVHQAMRDNIDIKQELLKNFSNVFKNGEVCRLSLGKEVFSNKTAMKKLEDIIHPYTHNKLRELAQTVKKSGGRSLVVEVPLLFEKNRAQYFDWIICLYSSTKTMLKRASLRKRMTKEMFFEILAKQMPADEKIRQSDYTICSENGLYMLYSLKKIINYGRFKRDCSGYRDYRPGLQTRRQNYRDRLYRTNK
ncbi:dephospho-CoA kinase [Candidatus Bandiella euplotis]|uniref:dephospho-CoA kinase n=1 Tax=Candidatus Bandiella euplotis TaxID=1664265 RepID=UPI002B25C681|nr:dephospho-CoA kinase [Candidatus Bandiella woodruffii]